MSGPALAAVLAASAVALGACGGGDKEPARAGTPTATPTAEESARAAADASGSATYCVGRGSRYSERQAVDAFNAAQAVDGVHVRRAIYTNVHAALTGRLSPEQALDRADRQIERALARHG